MKKFFVVYSLKDIFHPCLFKTHRSAKNKVDSIEELTYETFDNQIQAEKFLFSKKMKFFSLQQQLAKKGVQPTSIINTNQENNLNSTLRKPDISTGPQKQFHGNKNEFGFQEFTDSIKGQLKPVIDLKFNQIKLPDSEDNPIINPKVDVKIKKPIKKPKQPPSETSDKKENEANQELNTNYQGTIDSINLKKTYQEVLKLLGSSEKFVKSDPLIRIRSDKMYYAYFDGCSKSNPGSSGAGYVVLTQNNKAVFQRSINLGIKTNNQAEYLSLLICLLDCKFNKINKLQVFGDSQLVVNGVTNKWNITQVNLTYLNMLCKHFAKEFSDFGIAHIRRQNNTYADKLSNKGLKQEYRGKNFNSSL